MPDLTFAVESIDAAPGGLRAHLRIRNADAAEQVQSGALRCQIHIEPARRRYSGEEKLALEDIFGAPERWGETVKPLVWMNAVVAVPPFTRDICIDVPLSCSFDLNPRAATYLAALRDGEVPLTFLFSGTVMTLAENGSAQASPIPWDREARYRLPVDICRNALTGGGPEPLWAARNRVAAEYVNRWRAIAGAAKDKP